MPLPDQYPTQAQLGYTTSLQRGEVPSGGGEPDYQDIGEVTDLTGWDASRDTVEVTNHRSPDFSVESIPGLIDWGEASFELNFVPKLAADDGTPLGALLEDFKSAGNKPWRIIMPPDPDGTLLAVEFLASLTSYQVTMPVKDVMKGSFALKYSGPPRFVAVNGTSGSGGGGGGGGIEQTGFEEFPGAA